MKKSSQKEEKSSRWDYFFNLIKKKTGMIKGYPFSEIFPEFFDTKQYDLILVSRKVVRAIVDDSKIETLEWREKNGERINRSSVAAWKQVDAIKTPELPENPKEFLDKMKKDAADKTKQIKDLIAQIQSLAKLLQFDQKIILLRKRFAEIKGCYRNVISTPFVITGFDICAIPWRNNSFARDANCGIDVVVRFFIKQPENLFDDDSIVWSCSVTDLQLENKFGIITNLSNKGWDAEILISEISDFKKIKTLIKNGVESLGLAI